MECIVELLYSCCCYCCMCGALCLSELKKKTEEEQVKHITPLSTITDKIAVHESNLRLGPAQKQMG